MYKNPTIIFAQIVTALSLTGAGLAADFENQIVTEADQLPITRRTNDGGQIKIIADSAITEAVKSRLHYGRFTTDMAIEVETHLGKVTLTGTVDSDPTKILATQMASTTRGVTSVDNQLVVISNENPPLDSPPPSTSDTKQYLVDSWISAQIHFQYFFTKSLAGSDISVRTSNNVVTLSGKVNSAAQHIAAIELAGQISGVSRVESSTLTY